MPPSTGRPIPSRVTKRAYEAWTTAANGCYVSTYSTGSHGYAQIGWYEPSIGRTAGTLAHRAAWVHVNGQIPVEMTVDHRPTCDRRCVNVDHLRLLTNYENARRTSGRDWPLGECINGHPNSELFQKGTKTRCRICSAAEQRRYHDKKRAS